MPSYKQPPPHIYKEELHFSFFKKRPQMKMKLFDLPLTLPFIIYQIYQKHTLICTLAHKPFAPLIGFR